jgi:hypothetical protein
MTVVPQAASPAYIMHPRDVWPPDAPLAEAELRVLRNVSRTNARRDAFDRRVREQHLQPQHGPTPELRSKTSAEVMPKVIFDANHRLGQPYIGIDTLERMERRGTITREMHGAAARLRQDFRLANLDPLRAAPFEPASRSTDGACLSEKQEAARQRVHAALSALGGRSSPAGSCVWSVIGEEKTLKDWAWANGWGCRPVGGEASTGVLVGSLSCLVAHYYNR